MILMNFKCFFNLYKGWQRVQIYILEYSVILLIKYSVIRKISLDLKHLSQQEFEDRQKPLCTNPLN